MFNCVYLANICSSTSRGCSSNIIFKAVSVNQNEKMCRAKKNQILKGHPNVHPNLMIQNASLIKEKLDLCHMTIVPHELRSEERQIYF